MMDVKLFVIIVTYKGKQWFDRCFASLRESTIPVQTIVVDNASNDGSVEYIKEHFPEIHLIESKVNLGFGNGNNLALKYAYEHGCDYVFLMNQDTWLDDVSTLEKLVEVARKHPEFAIISPMHMAPDHQSVGMMMECGGNKYTMQIVSDLYCGIKKEIYETNYVNATAWLLTRKTLSALGGFDPLFFHYGEDDDYLNRARFHGLKIGVCLDARIVHDHKPEEFVEISRVLSQKAANDNLGPFLDLNQPFNYHRLRSHYLWKYIRGVVFRDVKLRHYAMYRFKYLKRMRSAIEFSRSMNAIKQPNWIQ